MSQFEKWVLKELERLYLEHKQPVRTVRLACEIPKHERIIRGGLASLRAQGKVARVGTQRNGGWVPMQQEVRRGGWVQMRLPL